MILHNRYNKETGITTSELVEYDEENIERSKNIFKNLNEDGIIIGNFDNTIWLMDDEYEKIRLRFEFDELKYAKEFKNRDIYTFEQFINSVKSYMVFSVTKYSISSLNICLTSLIKYAEVTDYFNKEKSKNIDINKLEITQLRFIEGYLNFIEFDGVEYYRDLIEEHIEYNLSVCYEKNNNKDKKSSRRDLADFQSIFLFNKIIEDFWKYGDSKDKDKYLILYIWWKISNIIPLRLKEFCITPYDCIEVYGDKYYIKLRRSKIKGNKGNNTITYKIDEDYSLNKYNTTKEIYDLISKYKQITEPYRDNNNLLICYSTYRVHFVGKKYNYEEVSHINNSFRRETLSTLLKRFFIEIIQGKYNYNIVEYNDFVLQRIATLDDEGNAIEMGFKPLEDKEITMFRTGDIRHCAIINMVLNDINPILVKDIVDHENINTTFHYFGNIDELVRCISYIKYKELCKNKPSIEKSKGNRSINVSANQIFNQLEEVKSVEVDYGRCSSKNFINGKLNDCMFVDNCEDCDFFIEEKPLSKEELEIKLKILQLDIKMESQLLEELLKSYKNTSKMNEEVIRHSLKLQNSVELYYGDAVKNGGILWEK